MLAPERSDQEKPRHREAFAPDLHSGAACRLFQGDNLDSLQIAADQLGSCVSFAYLDPPFFTRREHYRQGRGEAQADGRRTRSRSVAFDDRWPTLRDYLSMLEARIRVVRQLLKPNGSLVVHVDPKTSHYVKVLCDDLFGMDCFASEVIWRYRRWPAKTANFQRVHDVMLRYVRDASVKPTFNQLYEPLAPSTRATWGTKKQRAVTDKQGYRLRSSRSETESRGTPLSDVWEMSIVAPVAKERTGYPTQKPEALMRRWIEACSNEGDLVLDPFMGSGTTLVAAHQLGRRSLGMDSSPEALAVTRQRLEDGNIDYSLHQPTSGVGTSGPSIRKVSPPNALASADHG